MTETEPDWSVGIVAQTVTGDVALKMTSDQATELLDALTWLVGGES